jgi:hypothetical protein
MLSLSSFEKRLSSLGKLYCYPYGIVAESAATVFTADASDEGG